MSSTAFWVDDEYDQEYASDGRSRFGVYIRSSSLISGCLEDTDDDEASRRTRFAAAVWETANSPIMAPGYVRRHPRIRRSNLLGGDDTLTASVELAAPWPGRLARSYDWQQGTLWRDWLTESAGGRTCYYEPEDDTELRGKYYLLTTARLLFPVPVRLPAVPVNRAGAVITARELAAGLAAAMNTAVAPLIAALEAGS